ncbi:hypothetical protein DGMP_24040 [Desulfomarina profundi]|uniref:Uncharacterized protein n=1 Tax=Desulfomarina profundi TaxID=2772557 RepID=A0A8D5FJG7_9BACT|nr:hypothetical protein DGMP_24040 [Desulfomarina profundi]
MTSAVTVAMPKEDLLPVDHVQFEIVQRKNNMMDATNAIPFHVHSLSIFL